MVELTAPGTRSRLYCWQACTYQRTNMFSGHSWPSSRERGLLTSPKQLPGPQCFLSSADTRWRSNHELALLCKYTGRPTRAAKL